MRNILFGNYEIGIMHLILRLQLHLAYMYISCLYRSATRCELKSLQPTVDVVDVLVFNSNQHVCNHDGACQTTTRVCSFHVIYLYGDNEEFTVYSNMRSRDHQGENVYRISWQSAFPL